MVRKSLCLLTLSALFVCISVMSRAQVPTGTISGLVSDPSGAAISGANLRVTNTETGFSRTLTSGEGGTYTVSSLVAGHYRVEATVKSFKRLIREADVAAGTDTTVDLPLQVGATTEEVTVTAATDQIDYETHSVAGTVEKEEIDSLPLNGREFMQLASLQPGVGVSLNSVSKGNKQYQVSIQGGDPDSTRVTVDGVTIRESVDGGTNQNFSQEIVQEFQIATTNFDLSAGGSASGAINIVTRTGGNQFHGTGYFFYRDHNMAAYPGLTFNPQNPDPYFVRRQSGGSISGPILKDRLFFFFNAEHNNQLAVTDIQPSSPSLAHFGGIFPSPYHSTQISNRFDYRVNDKNTLFLRYSHDSNNAFGLTGNGSGMPSNWTNNTNWADQTALGLTTTLSSHLVNEAHLAYSFWDTKNQAAGASCPNCIGVGGPEVRVDNAGFTIGNQSDAPQSIMERHYILNDSLTWQKGTHEYRFGGEVDHQHLGGLYSFDDPAQIDLWSPEEVNNYNLANPSNQIAIPSSFNTLADIMSLPMMDFTVGIGNPSQPAPFQSGNATVNTHYNVYATDSWKVANSLTVTYGLGWTFDNNLMNYDLSKPDFLAPLVGQTGLGYPHKSLVNISPTLGFAWSPTKDRNTVIRGGIGMYYDSANLSDKLEERAYLGPIGNGRYPIPGSLAGLDFQTVPTSFSGNDLLYALPTITQGITQEIAQFGSPTSLVERGINLFKSADDLYPTNYRTPESQHFNLGVEHRLSANWVSSLTGVWKHSLYGTTDVDLNHYYAANGSVIPNCSGSQQLDVTAECSSDSIGYLLPVTRSRYASLVFGVERQMVHNLQVKANYTYQNMVGFNGVWDLTNIFSSWGQQMGHHGFVVSGSYRMPWGFSASLVNTVASKGPFTAYIGGIDLGGSGVSNTLLPGAPYGSFGMSKGKSDLANLVSIFNATYAGTTDARGQSIPTLTLPDHYGFGEGLIDQDARLGKTFTYRERLGLNVFGECFNCFNISNLQGYSGNLVQSSFGQPTARIQQVFGSGGPRAFQVAARVSF